MSPLDAAMTPEEFRRDGHALIDWIASYRAGVEQYPVLSRSSPGSVMESLPASAPELPGDVTAILEDVETHLLPGIAHWQSPNWFGYFPSNSSEPSVLGDLLSSGLGVQGMLWATSPACTELEMRMLDWTVEALGLPAHFRFDAPGPGGGVIQDTASSAVLACMVAAREQATGGGGNIQGLSQDSSPLVAYASAQSHSSIEKSARICGIGSRNLRLVETDEHLAMDPLALASVMKKDSAAGCRPFFISATLGTTGTGAFDPLDSIAPLAKEHGCWLHVDAAMFGTAALCEEHRWMHAGVEQADSWSFNPHKWMGATFDCSCLWLKDASLLVDSMSIMPEYLRNKATESGGVVDYRDWHVQLGRRFRSLKLWFLYRVVGLEGLRTMVRKHVEITRELASWIDETDGFELAAPVPLTLACFRHEAGDEATRAIMEAVNASGSMSLTHCEVDGRFVLRLAIGQWGTTLDHVRKGWELISTVAKEVTSS
ncbi:MAG: pyridoxal-dependent decarboxylase [Planctomycetota bacterium]|nr:pyridoxal-dependent decarboxylase [Planctomycetota bacterium]